MRRPAEVRRPDVVRALVGPKEAASLYSIVSYKPIVPLSRVHNHILVDELIIHGDGLIIAGNYLVELYDMFQLALFEAPKLLDIFN